MNAKIFQAVLLLVLMGLTFGGCEQNCGLAGAAVGPCPCSSPVSLNNRLLVNDFETDLAAEAACELLNPWSDQVSSVQVSTEYTKEAANQFVKLQISDNNGLSPSHWTGAGLSLRLSTCLEGINVSNYDSLQFDIKMLAGSRLDAVKFKLQDPEHSNTRTVQVQSAHFRLTDQWQTASIPLQAFTDLGANPQGFEILDTDHVTHLVSVSIHNGTQPYNVDGCIAIDNIQFKRN